MESSQAKHLNPDLHAEDLDLTTTLEPGGLGSNNYEFPVSLIEFSLFKNHDRAQVLRSATSIIMRKPTRSAIIAEDVNEPDNNILATYSETPIPWGAKRAINPIPHENI